MQVTKVNGDELDKVQSFNYLGYFFQKNSGFNEDINSMIKCVQMDEMGRSVWYFM